MKESGYSHLEYPEKDLTKCQRKLTSNPDEARDHEFVMVSIFEVPFFLPHSYPPVLFSHPVVGVEKASM